MSYKTIPNSIEQLSALVNANKVLPLQNYTGNLILIPTRTERREIIASGPSVMYTSDSVIGLSLSVLKALDLIILCFQDIRLNDM